MKKQIEVTLIIPNYNNSKFLRKCVESAVNQTHPLKEILIVDDKSTDNSANLIRELENEYDNVRGIFQEVNGGVSKARNKGLEEAKTEYVTYMDADDFYYNKKKIENEVRMISKYRGMGKDILAYSFTAHSDNDGNIKKTWSFHHTPKIEFINGYALYQLLSLAKQRRIPRDYIIKKSILKEIGAYSFYKNLYEDLDLLMRIARAGVPFYCTGEFGTCYRKSVGGLSKKSKEELQDTIHEIVLNYYNELNIIGRLKVLCWKLFGFIWAFPYKAKAVMCKMNNKH